MAHETLAEEKCAPPMHEPSAGTWTLANASRSATTVTTVSCLSPGSVALVHANLCCVHAYVQDERFGSMHT